MLFVVDVFLLEPCPPLGEIFGDFSHDDGIGESTDSFLGH
jgi:hypothetical protein